MKFFTFCLVSKRKTVFIIGARGALRGGNWNNSSNAGLFNWNLNNTPSNTDWNIGFRCSNNCVFGQNYYKGL